MATTVLRLLAITFITMMADPALCVADERVESSRPRIAFVLSGGGARGAAHIGVLKVLEELRVPADYIAGTSMGAIVGGLYSSGYSPEEMESVVTGVDWQAMFRDKPDRRRISFRRKEDDIQALFPFELGVSKKGISGKSGVITAQKIEFLFRTLTLDMARIGRFDDLPLPFRAVAADLKSGEAIVLDRGDLARAMRASMSIPGVFTPVEIDGRLMVDGGITLNLPVDVARTMGAERILAVNVGTPPKDLVENLSAVGVYSQTFAVMGEANVKEQLRRLGEQDLLITPVLDEIGAGDFGEIRDAIAAGEEAARGMADELRAFSVSEEDYTSFLNRQRRDRRAIFPEVTVDEIDLVGIKRLDPDALKRRMKTRPGRPLDSQVLLQDLERISQAGEYESVGYRLVDHEGRNRIVIEAKEKSWGPGYLRFGMGLESNFEGDSDFRAILNYRHTELNRLGAEWKTVLGVGDLASVSTEFYQPLEASGFWFVAPRLTYEREKKDIFLGSDDPEVFKLRTSAAGLDLGVQLRNYGEIRVGVITGKLHADPVTATALDSVDPRLGGGRIRIKFDQADNIFFPTKGNLATLELFLSREGLGADEEYEKLSFGTTQAWTRGRNTFVGRAEIGTDFDSGLPFYDQFELGGFLNITGLEPGRLQGEVKGVLGLVDYWRIGKLGSLGKLYLGGAIEAGNVWPDVHDVSTGDLIYSGALFFGLDTKFAPLYVGYGHTDSGEDSYFLFLGRAVGR